MKNPKVADIVGIINKIAPVGLAEAWDNPGLQVGDPAAEVSRVMVALDPAPDVIDSALKASCQLLVTHHPLIFKPLKSISTANPHGATIQKALKGGLSIVSMHTNYDIASGGLNDLLAGKIGLSSCVPLKVTNTSELVKLIVFVPAEQLEQLRSVLLPFAAAQGNYRDCSFAADGVGTFTPLDGAEPFAGTINMLAEVHEKRLELLLQRTQLPRAIKVLLAAHPYEEPAFDVYPLHNDGEKLGIGRVGLLPEPLTLAEYAAQLRKSLSAPVLRYVGEPTTKVSKVALCSGSGASLLREAARLGADVLVTGDIKYHDARDAEDMGLTLIDAGHFPTEIIMVDEITGRLRQALTVAGYTGCHVEACRAETDPFRI
ncbi:MAG: Nif3-like dinuclear metal center hexameric protein [Desulfuromonadaceae bacterium]|nr:Nif3-like dinuclear metal center hexameric protein [Desulfuromonadaceae bacterium]MDD4130737.1 Nif3-like dinuclear metal center hexameric protein [Desulfuromonadaceae bacterium]